MGNDEIVEIVEDIIVCAIKIYWAMIRKSAIGEGERTSDNKRINDIKLDARKITLKILEMIDAT